jgi:DNA-directed RNA polymerase-3 subunit RPC5
MHALTGTDQLHLTRLDGLVQLRTQFHHIDASAQLEAVSRRREKESQEGARPAEPKAFLPTVKKSGGDTAAELTQAFMKSANQEQWNKLNYSDEDVWPQNTLDGIPAKITTVTRSICCLQRATLPA